MVRLALILALAPFTASAADFSLTIGPPVAAGTDAKVVKKVAALFAVRLEECPDVSKAQITATANMMVNQAVTTVPAMIESGGKPGIYMVSRNWSGGGNAVVNVNATCGGAKAGAVVPIGAQGFSRESVKTFQRAVTPADVEAGFRAMN